jgi:hypothetical protein
MWHAVDTAIDLGDDQVKSTAHCDANKATVDYLNSTSRERSGAPVDHARAIARALVRAQQRVMRAVTRQEPGIILNGEAPYYNRVDLLRVWENLYLPPEHAGAWNLVIWDMRVQVPSIELHRGDPLDDPRYRATLIHEGPATVQKYLAHAV